MHHNDALFCHLMHQQIDSELDIKQKVICIYPFLWIAQETTWHVILKFCTTFVDVGLF